MNRVRINENIEVLIDKLDKEYQEPIRDLLYVESILRPHGNMISESTIEQLIYASKRKKGFNIARVELVSGIQYKEVQEVNSFLTGLEPNYDDKVKPEELSNLAKAVKDYFKKIKRYSLEEWYSEKADKTSTIDIVIGHKELNRNEEIVRLRMKGIEKQVWKESTMTRGDVEYSIFYFIIPFNLKDAFKETFKAISMETGWDATNKLWYVNPTIMGHEGQAKALENKVKEFVMQHDITLHSDLMYQWYGDRESVIASLQAGEEFQIENMKLEPYPYQKAGIKYGTTKKRVLFADEMGLGKTVQAIACVLHENAFPCIVICPKSVVYNWKKEWTKFTHITASVYGEYSNKADVIICSYNNAKKMLKAKHMFKSIIVDESHYIKDEKTQRYKIVKELSENKEYRYLLTGTPVINQPAELIPQLYVLGYLKAETKPKFLSRYVGPKNTGKNLDELQMKLRSTCMVRRMKIDVQKELPEKIRQIINIDIENRELYNMANKQFVDYLNEKLKMTAEQARKILRAEFITKINHLKKIAATGRIEGMIEFVKNMNENGEKVIIFAHHRAIIDELSKKLDCSLKITGETETKMRQTMIERFQQQQNEMNIILSIRAASTGIDGLQDVCSNVVFAELDWTAAQHDQAEDRAHRNGQLSTVNAYYFIAPETIDEKIFELIESKRNMSNAATGSEDYAKRNVNIFAELMHQQFGVDIFLKTSSDITDETPIEEDFKFE
jgi:SWI/SNF-related matrix-associated actin-dependent regulator 1 of chromatin subfamily A